MGLSTVHRIFGDSASVLGRVLDRLDPFGVLGPHSSTPAAEIQFDAEEEADCCEQMLYSCWLDLGRCLLHCLPFAVGFAQMAHSLYAGEPRPPAAQIEWMGIRGPAIGSPHFH